MTRSHRLVPVRAISIVLLSALIATTTTACGRGDGEKAGPGGAPAASAPLAPVAGAWRATLQTPGGDLPFDLELQPDGERWRATIRNAAERIDVPLVEVRGDSVILAFPHFASRIAARVEAAGTRLGGQWSLLRSADLVRHVPFTAQAGAAPRFAPPADAPPRSVATVAGRWRVDFADEDIDAVGIFQQEDSGELTGTFLTATGDYRFLEGAQYGDRVRLSTFDGAHAFLFDLRVEGDVLTGDFFSGAHFHDTFVGARDPRAALPDAFTQSVWAGSGALGDLSFPDLEGRRHRLDDPAFAGKARILYLFGSWCPNCGDATELLVEFDERYRDRGLSVLGLAFESTGDFARDAAQVRRYARRHEVTYPLLVAGLRDKDRATEAFPLLDRVRSYPTTIFLDGDGTVRAVHSGFSGPATGAAHLELRARWTELVEELLSGDGR